MRSNSPKKAGSNYRFAPERMTARTIWRSRLPIRALALNTKIRKLSSKISVSSTAHRLVSTAARDWDWGYVENWRLHWAEKFVWRASLGSAASSACSCRLGPRRREHRSSMKRKFNYCTDCAYWYVRIFRAIRVLPVERSKRKFDHERGRFFK